MRILVTGARGTLGRVFTQVAESQNHTVIAWNRDDAPPYEPNKMEAYVETNKPDAIVHLATASQSTGRDNEGWLVDVEWNVKLAEIAKSKQIPYAFTSSVMVYTNDAKGPFTVDTPPDEIQGYGFNKAMAEKRVLDVYPEAVVARIGWQIGEEAGSNNMIDFIENQQAEHGHVNVSRKWYPATSFLTDTATSILSLLQNGQGLLFVR